MLTLIKVFLSCFNTTNELLRPRAQVNSGCVWNLKLFTVNPLCEGDLFWSELHIWCSLSQMCQMSPILVQSFIKRCLNVVLKMEKSMNYSDAINQWMSGWIFKNLSLLYPASLSLFFFPPTNALSLQGDPKNVPIEILLRLFLGELNHINKCLMWILFERDLGTSFKEIRTLFGRSQGHEV